MKGLKAKIGVLALCSACLLPAAAHAADSTVTSSSATTPVVISSVVQTNVNGIMVPGIYLVNEDSRVAFIPGGIGVVVVNKNTALPFGAFYLKK